MVLDSTFTNSFNEPFSVFQLKYYISNISFTDIAGKENKVVDSYFLIDEQNADSKIFTVKTSSQTISAVNFYIGVDSLRNVSGVQTDALDPMNGMFWTWSTGYIMAKFEGTSPVSKAPMNRISFHIGGYKTGQNVAKKISLPLLSPIDLTKENNVTVSISADLDKWFTGITDIKFADVNFCMNPGELANKIAANYAAMFTIASVKAN